MKLNILQSDLYSPLQAVSRSISAKPQLPVLANILLQTEENQLKISATNLEIGIIKKIPAEILEQGDITIPAKVFTEIISSLAGEKISLESSNEQLKIETTAFSGVLNGIAATEFPTIPLAAENTFSIPAAVLKESLPQISFAAAIDEARPTLTGILTEIQDNSLELVATDGFRLAHKKMHLSEPLKTSFKSLIPKRTFEEVIRIISEDLKEEESKITIGTTENQNQIIFLIGNTELSSRLIEGNYPTWEKIVPTQFQTTIQIDRSDLMKAIKVASVFVRDAANVVKLDIKKDKMKILSEARELGSQETDLDLTLSGEEIIIAFNNKYLLDALSNSHSRKVEIKFSGNLSSALIKPLEEEGLEYVVMPIRIS